MIHTVTIAYYFDPNANGGQRKWNAPEGTIYRHIETLERKEWFNEYGRLNQLIRGNAIGFGIDPVALIECDYPPMFADLTSRCDQYLRTNGKIVVDMPKGWGHGY